MKIKLLLKTFLPFLFICMVFACQHTSLEPSAEPALTESSSIMPFAETEEIAEPVNEGDDSEAASKVWVCNSSGAKKYHYNRDCAGLKRCTHTIEESTVKQAEAVGLGQCGYKKCR